MTWDSAKLDELKAALAEVEQLSAKLKTVTTPIDGVWFWQGNNDDHESLSCPVVMMPSTVVELVMRAQKAEAKLASIGELVANWTCQCCDCGCDGCKPCLSCRILELVKS